MVRVIQSYALISVGVKIIVTNLTTTGNSGNSSSGSGGKQTIFATQCGGKLSDNVSILFGAKFAASLAPIEMKVNLSKTQFVGSFEITDSASPEKGGEGDSPDSIATMDFGDFAAMNDSSSQHSFKLDGNSGKETEPTHINSKESSTDEATSTTGATPETNPAATITTVVSPASTAAAADVGAAECTVRGLVSKVGLGVGRSDNDRQFTFCNGRPVDLPRFAKVLNEVWRRYEMKQKPAFVLDIVVPPGYFDVNLTPDKREVLIVQEAVILERLREVVDGLYAPVRNTMPLNQGLAQGAVTDWACMFSNKSPSADANGDADIPSQYASIGGKVHAALADYLVQAVPSPQASTFSEQSQNCSPAASTQNLLATPSGVFPFTANSPHTVSTVTSTPTMGARRFSTSTGESNSAGAGNSEGVLVKRTLPETCWLSDVEKERLVLGSPPKRSRTQETESETKTESETAAGAAMEVAQEGTAHYVEKCAPKAIPWSADPSAALEKYQRRVTARHEKLSSSSSTASEAAVVAVGGLRNGDSAVDIPNSKTNDNVSELEDAFDISANAAVSSAKAASSSAQGDRSQARILNKKVHLFVRLFVVHSIYSTNTFFFFFYVYRISPACA